MWRKLITKFSTKTELFRILRFTAPVLVVLAFATSGNPFGSRCRTIPHTMQMERVPSWRNEKRKIDLIYAVRSENCARNLLPIHWCRRWHFKHFWHFHFWASDLFFSNFVRRKQPKWPFVSQLMHLTKTAFLIGLEQCTQMDSDFAWGVRSWFVIDKLIFRCNSSTIGFGISTIGMSDDSIFSRFIIRCRDGNDILWLKSFTSLPPNMVASIISLMRCWVQAIIALMRIWMRSLLCMYKSWAVHSCSLSITFCCTDSRLAVAKRCHVNSICIRASNAISSGVFCQS